MLKNARTLKVAPMAGEIVSIATLALALTMSGIAIGYGILWVWNGGSFSEEE
ncbi:MAG: hypothetical protein AAFY57_01330 [Cyanobacteria bacterium J06642_2]